MKRDLRRNIMIGLALVAISAGVVIAVMPGGGHHHARNRRRSAGTGHGHIDSEVQVAADYLGLGRTDVHRMLRSGKTLAEIAQSTPGRSPSGLIEALLASRASQLKSRGLTEQKERSQLAKLRTRILLELNMRRRRRGGITPDGVERSGAEESSAVP